MPLPRADDLTEFGEVFAPSEAAEPILAKPVRDALTEWLTEIWAEAELSAIGIGPRKRAMFAGKPGVGKTTLAHHLSARLGLTMVAVKPDRLIDRWLGSTGQNIGRLFDAACAADPPCVVFMDEMDAIAMKRRQKGGNGADDEQNSYVNTLLQRIEQYKGFLIAATNFAEAIDPAIWRRFDIHITLDIPGQRERERIIARYLSPYGLPASALRSLGEAFETASPALIRAFCENLKRQIIVGPKLKSDMRLSAVVDRILAGVHPHPDLGKPRLWSLGAKDESVRLIPWPLPMAVDIKADEPVPALADNVIPLGNRA
jgi:SpoVK/Ycf46/Vps4 family AAA+-type ATPase